MFVMGIPICLFMIGLLYFAIGIGEDLVLRERAQDAADAGALTAAIVHARGMNLIALLNMVMSALVALLIMVRMLEALLIVAIFLGSALSVPTFGASMSIVPPAEVAREEAHNAYEALKEVVEPIVEALHYLEIGIQYGMPAVAEVRVIEVTHDFQPVVDFGFAIPGDYPLPLQNGSWDELCKQAGRDSADMLMMPIGILIPVEQVKEALRSAIGGMTGTFPQLFCSPNGLSIPSKMPEVTVPPIARSVPPLASAAACQEPPAEASPTMFTLDDKGLPVNTNPNRTADQENRIGSKQEACHKAASETQRSLPDKWGNPGTECTYEYAEHGVKNAYNCEGGACLKDGVPCTEFTEKAAKAVEACRPGVTPNISSYNYQKQDLSWRAELIPVPDCGTERDNCKYRLRFVTQSPKHSEAFIKSSKPPCGTAPAGEIGPEYNTQAHWRAGGEYADSEYLCVQPHTVVEPSMLQAKEAMTLAEWQAEFNTADKDSHWQATTSPFVEPARPEGLEPDAPWPPPSQVPPRVPDEQLAFVGAWSAVTYLHSCDETVTNIDQTKEYQAAADRDAAQEQAQAGQRHATLGTLGGNGAAAGGCDQGDKAHLTMKDQDDDNILGGSTYQMRAIVIRNTAPSGAKRVVRSVPLRLMRGGEQESKSPASALVDIANHIYAAQAEYYFDTTYVKDAPEQVADLRASWMWNMRWKARMRRLRLPTSNSSSGNGSGPSFGGGAMSGGSSSSQGCGGASPPSLDIDTAYNTSAAQSGSDPSSAQPGAPSSSGSGALSSLQQIADTLIIH